ncbi:DNA repair exonuclease family protein [Desulforapulum autotrophicum HRM2]|uniref:DNA repair exonuclease family protein n=1 Tax=Desulforapulum autotrophicum (strain ATCC 43914 / DSM 3382 / VKM B-1955 / HRM2) TaxID=177437 RepID=C0QDX0_DESAH|nr:DNA repair exonuclease [Desulforapulum autotrophicum]ACN17391.1 DNA repair exonuclease family protein [Desulforapulum autotrophicum HRM2]
MVKFIHTADIHLDSPLKGLEVHDDAPVEEIRGATRRAFDNLIDLALEEEVDFILIAGDLYDGDWKDYNTGLFFSARMGKLSKSGIKVFIVSGNHDAASQLTKTMPLPDNVTLFSPRKPQSVKLDDIGVIIHGQSYSHRAVTENLASQYPQYDSNYFNIGLLHTSLTGREGHEDYAPCTMDDLKSKGYDYWALGHVHTREIISEDPWIVFPGNIQGRHIKETGAKGASLVSVEDGRIVKVEAFELDVLRWAVCQVDLSECETCEKIYDVVRQALEQALDQVDGKPLAIRLILTGSCPVHGKLLDQTTQWTEGFRSIAVQSGEMWLETVKFQTTRKVSLEEMFGEDNPIAGLLKSVQQIELDGETLFRLVPELSALKNKLPAEIQTGDESFLDPSPDKMEGLRNEIQELLIAKLLQHGGAK